MTYQIQQITDTEQFATLVENFDTLNYFISEVFENIETGKYGAIALVVTANGKAIAYIIADDDGCHFIETIKKYRRQGIATNLIKRTKSIFVHEVCSEACKEMCKKLGLEY
jgi:GNAT superfamily N-acetyltransferase